MFIRYPATGGLWLAGAFAVETLAILIFLAVRRTGVLHAAWRRIAAASTSRRSVMSLAALRRWWCARSASKSVPRSRPWSARLRVRQLETRLTPSVITLASFNSTNDRAPWGPLFMDSGGNLYGTTEIGGALGDGAVFELAAGSGTITSLASFNGTDGQNPFGGVVMDSKGDLYGTTVGGGAFGDGTVFEVAAGSGTITSLASFNGRNGKNPYAGLVMDGSGDLYGVTQGGGAKGDGTVFEVAPGSGQITTLASFNGSNGKNPYAGLVMDGQGDLYGTTTGGGANGDGTVFELIQGSNTITTLASFNGTDGRSPRAMLLMDGSGNLYGTTQVGGAANRGTVFEVAEGSGTITTLAQFNRGPGGQPQGPLVMDNHGNLYGATAMAATSNGCTVFEVVQGSGTVTTMTSLSAVPESGLVMDSSGNLYGTTTAGYGTVFELPKADFPDQWTGANYATDTNWSDGANWSLGTPPTASQVAIFTNNPTVQDLTSTVDAGFTGAIAGLDIDSTWGGTITVDSALTVTGDLTLASGTITANSALTVAGDLTLASGTLGGSGAVTISGAASQWTGGQIDLGSDGFTNDGRLTAYTNTANLILAGAGTFTNDGTITQKGNNSLVLENGATLLNAADAFFFFAYNGFQGGSVSQSGGGTFINAGILEKTGGTGTSTIATTTFSNTGEVVVGPGTLNITAAVAQVSGSTLTGGTWAVSSKLDITSAGSLTTIGPAAAVTLQGSNATFSNLKRLTTIDSGGSFSLLSGASFTTTGKLTDGGGLTLGPGSTLTVQGSFTQTSTGTLTIELGDTNGTPTFGQLASTTDTVTLAGNLQVTSGSTFVPAVGTAIEILDNGGNSAIRGTFAGLPEGATLTVTSADGTTTMVFTITYVGTDADGSNNVVITRIS
jgi:uncharacterized repeat protein (TIGR03803 family)